MKLYKLKYLLYLSVMMIMLSSCYKMRVEVNKIPSNTPEDADIYITGDFNNWDPGDPNFILKKANDSLYYFDLPQGVGTLEYKFTRGDWTTVEKDNCGGEADNRTLIYGDNQITTNAIYSWSDLDPVDCDKVVIVLSSLPENTPEDALLKLVGNFSNWEVSGDEYTFHLDEALNLPVLTVYRPQAYEYLEFKVTRGNLERSEADGLGNTIKPRTLYYGQADTLFLEVRSWYDLEQAKGNMITLLVERIPENTPEKDPIFFVGEINDWFPYDMNLRLEKNKKGQYFINLPKGAYNKEYKFTRGGWGTVEKDNYGYEINNRILEKEKSSDTVIVSIWNWADLSVPLGGELTIYISRYPRNTPEGADLYVAGNFNNWDAGDESWKFNSNEAGHYFISIPRQGNMLEFKITRGDWNTVEVDKTGKDIPNRIYRWGDVEWLDLEVVKWNDL